MTWAAVLTALTAPPLRGFGLCLLPGTTSGLFLWSLADKVQTVSGVRAQFRNVPGAPRGAPAGSPSSGAAWLLTASMLLQNASRASCFPGSALAPDSAFDHVERA